jgi:hypothetical protein
MITSYLRVGNKYPVSYGHVPRLLLRLCQDLRRPDLVSSSGPGPLLGKLRHRIFGGTLVGDSGLGVLSNRRYRQS